MLTATTHSTLQLGSTGDEVKYLQLQLNSFYGPVLIADGIFGTETQTQVQRFQAACYILVDGIVGAQTWSFLEEIIPYAKTVHSTLRLGSSGGEVKYLQARLNSYLNSQLVVDGLFYDRTEAQVKRFQKAAMLAEDGIVGSQTWQYLDQPNFDL